MNDKFDLLNNSIQQNDGFIHYVELSLLFQNKDIYAVCGQILYQNTVLVNLFQLEPLGEDVTCEACLYTSAYGVWLIRHKGR